MEEKETERCGYNEERQKWGLKDSEEQLGVSATWDHGEDQACAATNSLIGSLAPKQQTVGYHKRTGRQLWSELLPGSC